MPKTYKTVDDELFPLTSKHRKINKTTSINNFRTTSSSAQEVVHLDFHFRSKLLTTFYNNISKFKINSNIIIQNNIYLSNELIYHTKHNSQSIQSIPQLLYRGSRDGFKAIDFHSRCDNQGPTLTLIKSASDEPFNQIFGGFTTQSWEPPSTLFGRHIFDDSAFIFKIDDENKFRKFSIKQDKKKEAICVSTQYLPIFGGDIFIYSDCNLNKYSYSNFGFDYELLPTTTTTTTSNNDDEYQQPPAAGSEKPKSYNFKVSEIEVFKIITRGEI